MRRSCVYADAFRRFVYILIDTKKGHFLTLGSVHSWYEIIEDEL
jgi:hypothetical protein